MKKIYGITLLVLGLMWLIPWSRINWGKITLQAPEVVSVSGEAKSLQKNEVASFSAGVMVASMDKNKAIEEVNTKINDLIKTVKEFGISPGDIKTENLSYYQDQKGDLNPGQWRVNSTIEVTLREATKASELTDLLAKTGANSVYGPNFRIDDVNQSEKGLYEMAMKDAREKAESMARASGRKLGKVLSVGDGGINTNYPMYLKSDSGLGGGAATEPGSSTVYKTINVVFELK